MAKALLIGLDGLMPELIERYKERLPELRSLLQDSFFTPALSSPYTDTPTNWTTIATGSSAATHGITGFKAHLPGMALGETTDTFGSDLCRAERIWEAAERQGKRCIAVNYPVAFPHDLKQGVLVGGDGLFSEAWSVRGPELFSSARSQEEVTDRKRHDVYYEPGRYETRIRLGEPSGWKNVPEAASLVKEGVVEIRDTVEVEWSEAGGRIKGGGAPASSGAGRRHVLVFSEAGVTRLMLTEEKDFSRPIAVMAEGEWSGWVEERFHGRRCLRQYKALEVSKTGETVRIYGTIAGGTEGWSFPRGLEAELIREASPYVEGLEISNVVGILNGWFGWKTSLELFDLQLDALHRITSHLARNRDWDLLLVQYHAPDGVCHLYMRDLEEDDPETVRNADDRLFDVVKRLIDFVARIRQSCADGDTVTCVVSDHGTIPIRHCVNPNHVLEAEGLTLFRPDEDGRGTLVDGSRSKVIADKGGFWISRHGRERDGIVRGQEEYERIRSRLITVFSSLTSPETGEPVFSLVGKREDFAWLGMDSERFPDVIVFCRPYHLFLEGRSGAVPDQVMRYYREAGPVTTFARAAEAGLVGSSTSVHWHLPGAETRCSSNRAVLLLQGPGIRRAAAGGPIRLMDVAPTLSHIVGMRPPLQSEGRILFEAIEPSSQPTGAGRRTAGRPAPWE